MYVIIVVRKLSNTKELNEFWYYFILKEHPDLYWATRASLELQKGDYLKLKTLHGDKPLEKMVCGGFPGDYIKELKAFRNNELWLYFY